MFGKTKSCLLFHSPWLLVQSPCLLLFCWLNHHVSSELSQLNHQLCWFNHHLCWLTLRYLHQFPCFVVFLGRPRYCRFTTCAEPWEFWDLSDGIWHSWCNWCNHRKLTKKHDDLTCKVGDLTGKVRMINGDLTNKNNKHGEWNNWWWLCLIWIFLVINMYWYVTITHVITIRCDRWWLPMYIYIYTTSIIHYDDDDNQTWQWGWQWWLGSTLGSGEGGM